MIPPCICRGELARLEIVPNVALFKFICGEHDPIEDIECLRSEIDAEALRHVDGFGEADVRLQARNDTQGK